MRRGRAPRRQRWRQPGPTLALGVRPHLPRSPWRRRRRALLPRTADGRGEAAAAPAAPNGAFHHNEAGRDLCAAARPRRPAIGPRAASRERAGLQGDGARGRRRRRVKRWRRVPGWAVSRGRLRGRHVGPWQPPFCVLASGPLMLEAAPALAVARRPHLYPPTHARPWAPVKRPLQKALPSVHKHQKSALGQSRRSGSARWE